MQEVDRPALVGHILCFGRAERSLDCKLAGWGIGCSNWGSSGRGRRGCCWLEEAEH